MRADEIDYMIVGSGDMQLVEIELDPNESVRAEVGTMLFMEQGIEMQTATDGGLFTGLKRMITGDSFFITSFLNKGNKKQKVAFAAPYPGKIIPIDLHTMGGTFICQKDSFLCAAKGINIEIEFTRKIGTGLFGGEGFILQRLRGDGLAFVHSGGTVISKRLAPNEVLRIDTGCIVGFEQSVDYDIQFVGGFKNALFGGEGLFLATVRGPGVVYIQSLPFSKLADRILSASMGRSKEQSGFGINSIFGGD
ncbi:hypothetical protein CHS0354_000500 [Potamilus streckersoni]|uniref:TIGR00266 family protein n=1 Tax=Potamilus streckersoni TaxID=2493646 RepID=A0AAE0T7X0_9BIVA|nr:hypothetical protein CHS0354_000500 [Potamilus streckersoni]